MTDDNNEREMAMRAMGLSNDKREGFGGQGAYNGIMLARN